MSLREKVVSLLEERNYPAMLDYAKKDGGIFRVFIALAYDREDVVAWRAIEAFGITAGGLVEENPEKVRHLAQRLLWMMREESGNNPWSAPEILGEIVRNCHKSLADFAPIVSSFHDEEILRRGVLRSMARMAEVRPDLIDAGLVPLEEYLGHPDPYTRAFAARLAAVLGLTEFRSRVESLVGDDARIRVYRDNGLHDETVGKSAEESAILLREKG